MLSLAIRHLVISEFINRVSLKGSAASGRIEAGQFEWGKEKCIRCITSVKMMGSYVGLIICSLF